MGYLYNPIGLLQKIEVEIPGANFTNSDTTPITFYQGNPFLAIAINLIFNGNENLIYTSGVFFYINLPADYNGQPMANIHLPNYGAYKDTLFTFLMYCNLPSTTEGFQDFTLYTFTTSVAPVTAPIAPDTIGKFTLIGYYL